MDPSNPPQPNSQYPPQIAPPVSPSEPEQSVSEPDQDQTPELTQQQTPQQPAPGLNFGPPVVLPGETADINTLVREVQLADGIDVGRNWYASLKINPKSNTQGMFDTFMAKYREDFPYLELPDETTKRFPRKRAVDLGAKIIRPREQVMTYESGLRLGYVPVDTLAADAEVQPEPLPTTDLPGPDLPVGTGQAAPPPPAEAPAPEPEEVLEQAETDPAPLPKLPKTITTPRKGFR
jgi:hypothetical protein